MFDIFKAGKPGDIKGIRNSLLQFIKEELQKAEGGEGRNIKGLCLYIACGQEEKHLYEAALYTDEENKFKEEEVQRIVDDYAIALPPTWTFEIEFLDELPKDAVRAVEVDAALFISTKSKPGVSKQLAASIRVLNGEAEKAVYQVESGMAKMNIGREKNVQTAEGYFRENHLAFLPGSTHESNRSVSRQHAHIEWNADTGAFYLFADEGGVPPHNKVKVCAKNGQPYKLQTIEIGHRLEDGDQVIIGESAVLEFSFDMPVMADSNPVIVQPGNE
jgi:hypothetical protein